VFSVVRVLLDECLPWGLARELAGHEIDTVTQLGWSGVTNGELLRRAAGQYDFLITIDQRFAE
jgi:predicted nuclease of predicted toxin-antitoxin system